MIAFIDPFLLHLINKVDKIRVPQYTQVLYAQVVKLVDTPDLGSGAVRCVGSSPILGTLPNVLSEMFKRSAFLCPNSC